MKTPSVRNKPLFEKQNVTRLSGHIIQIDGCRHVLVLVEGIPLRRLRVTSPSQQPQRQPRSTTSLAPLVGNSQLVHVTVIIHPSQAQT